MVRDKVLKKVRILFIRIVHMLALSAIHYYTLMWTRVFTTNCYI